MSEDSTILNQRVWTLPRRHFESLLGIIPDGWRLAAVDVLPGEVKVVAVPAPKP